MPKRRVAVAMSGGVDSSLAAALLQEAGYEVNGVYIQLFSGRNCSISDLKNIESLERTCHLRDIPLHKLNLETEFQNLVIDYFCQEYGLGHTPNPCIVCNRRIKFGLLLDRVLQMGAEYLATGHYAQIEHSPNGYCLLKAVDRGKDQSYFLYTLGQSELQHLLMPLGEHHKVEAKKMFAQRGLPTTGIRDSQNVCFIPNKDYRSFLAKHILLEPGDIVDIYGKVLGKHKGLSSYTVGQRQGLGLTSDKPLYVMKLDATYNRMVVAPRDQLISNTLFANKLSWISGRAPAESINVTAKIRYKSPEAKATLSFRNEGKVSEVSFHKPQWAIAPGQSIVFYQGNAVLGGGIIEDTEYGSNTISR